MKRVVTMRGIGGAMSGVTRCIPNVYIDGMPAFEAMDLLESYVRTEIEAVEIYVGYGTIPSEFDRANGCGTVLIWTKH